jgi:hypothetical protein
VTGLVPAIHVVELPETLGVAGNGATWMAGTSPDEPGHDGKGRYESLQRLEKMPPISRYL